MKDAEQRLIEWGREKHYPGWDIPMPTGGVLGRLMDEGRDERFKRRRRFGAAALDAVRRAIQKGRARVSLQVIPCKETRTARVEILKHEGESFAFAPDGGMGDMVDRMAKSIERSRNCRVVGELVELMPEDMRSLVRVTYGECATPNDVPRQAVGAASMLGVSERTYYRRKSEMLAWLSERLGLRLAAAA